MAEHYQKDKELQEISSSFKNQQSNLQQSEEIEENKETGDDRQIEEAYNDGQRKVDRALTLFKERESITELEITSKNQAKIIEKLDFLTQDQKDLLIKTLSNAENMMTEIHNSIHKYGLYEQVIQQLKDTLTTGSVLLFQIRSVIEILMKETLKQQMEDNYSTPTQKGEEDDKNSSKQQNINEEKEEIKEIENEMISSNEKFFINAKCRDQINLTTFALGAKVLNNYFEEIINICTSIQQPKLKKRLQSYLNDHKIVQAKLNTISEFLPYAVVFDKNDIFALDQKEHNTWKKINEYTTYIQIAPTEEIKKQFKAIVKAILLGNAMTAKGAERKSKVGQWLQRNLSALYYLCSPQTSERKAQIFFSNPDQKTAISVWNMMEKSVVYQALKIVLPSIKYNKKIYIEKNNIRFTKEIVLDAYKNKNLNSLYNQYEGVTFEEPAEQSNIDAYYNQLFKTNESKVKVRVLCSKNLVRPLPEDDKRAKDIIWHNSLIVHIHGGGFVAMGTRSHQMYSRKWANLLNIPIFSIDYQKAPEHPYPEGLDDCFQAYQWIVKHVHKYFNIRPEKIVVVGDSAGGNLTIALTALCIKYNVRIPDAIVPIYPALNLNLQSFTPSYLISLDDQILPHMFLKMCLSAYINREDGFNPSIDPFISPTMICEDIIKKFPPVRMQAGNCDPLHDECFRFLFKLINNGKNAKLIVYNDMPHGFLNYDAPGGMKQAKKCVEDAADFMKEFIQATD